MPKIEGMTIASIGHRIALRRMRHPRCDHARMHTGIGKYSPELRAIRFVTICDDCGAERTEISVEPYMPHYDPGGYPLAPATRAA
jgi:hypothetical protein